MKISTVIKKAYKNPLVLWGTGLTFIGGCSLCMYSVDHYVPLIMGKPLWGIITSVSFGVWIFLNVSAKILEKADKD